MKHSVCFEILLLVSLSFSLSGTALGRQPDEHGKMMGGPAAPVKGSRS